MCVCVSYVYQGVLNIGQTNQKKLTNDHKHKERENKNYRKRINKKKTQKHGQYVNRNFT